MGEEDGVVGGRGVKGAFEGRLERAKRMGYGCIGPYGTILINIQSFHLGLGVSKSMNHSLELGSGQGCLLGGNSVGSDSDSRPIRRESRLRWETDECWRWGKFFQTTLQTMLR